MRSEGARSTVEMPIPDAGPVSAALARLVEDWQQVSGYRPRQVTVLQRLSRPYSELARVRIDHEGGPTTVYVKVARPRRAGAGEVEFMRARVAKDYEVTRRTYAALPVSAGLTAVRPIACYPEHLTLVTEETAGTPLLVCAEAGLVRWAGGASRQAVVRQVGRVGQWVRAFQQAMPSAEALSFDDLREYTDLRLARLAAHPEAAFTHRDRTGVLAALERDFSRVSAGDAQAVTTHSDFALGNVLVADERVIVLDFAMAASGAKYDDLAHLWMQIGLLRLKPTFHAGAVQSAGAALLAGFESADLAEAPLFRAMLARHVACHYLGLVERPAALPERVFNRWVAWHHLQWLRRYAEEGR